MTSHPLTAYKSLNARTKHSAWHWSPRVSTKSVIDFTRSFAMMVGARLSLLQALETAGRQSENERLKDVIRNVVASIRSGESLSASLSRHPRVFDTLYIQLTRIGEEAGVLDDMLMRLAAHKEKSADMRRKIKQAMAYPALVLSVALGATIFLLTSIVPTFAEMFESFGAELPGPTRIILGISHFLTDQFLTIGTVLMCLFFLTTLALKQAGSQYRLHRWSLKLPLFGQLIVGNHTARFCRMLGTMLESGVHLADALEILTDSTSNRYIRDELYKIRKRILRGDSLHKPMARAAFFPSMVVQMIAAGEETSELGPMLMHTADYYEAEIDSFLGSLSNIIEPIMIVLIGVLLGGILVAMYLPMFDLANIVQ